jgi:hypothetical protein
MYSVKSVERVRKKKEREDGRQGNIKKGRKK